MSLHSSVDGGDPVRPERLERSAGPQEKRPTSGTWRLATGTLACPECDAPVAPAGGPLSPADPLDCPFCGHAAAVRDFLSLTSPTRPARVEVRVVARPLRPERRAVSAATTRRP